MTTALYDKYYTTRFWDQRWQQYYMINITLPDSGIKDDNSITLTRDLKFQPIGKYNLNLKPYLISNGMNFYIRRGGGGEGSSWLWSYSGWFYNYLCNQCLLPPTLWVRIPFRIGVLDTTLCDKVCRGSSK